MGRMQGRGQGQFGAAAATSAEAGCRSRSNINGRNGVLLVAATAHDMKLLCGDVTLHFSSLLPVLAQIFRVPA